MTVTTLFISNRLGTCGVSCMMTREDTEHKHHIQTTDVSNPTACFELAVLDYDELAARYVSDSVSAVAHMTTQSHENRQTQQPQPARRFATSENTTRQCQ